jgi:hypothetical protein
MIRFKLDEYVNVTIRSEVIAKNRPEQRKPANVVPLAEPSKPFPIDRDAASLHRSTLFS